MDGGRDPGGHPPTKDALRASGARERILEAAYSLFSRHGIHLVGIDAIISEADVAKATLYHHFPSKDALVLAFLDLREQRWTYGWLKAEAERRAVDPADRAVAVFDALDDWFHRPDYEGCSFINTLLEIADRDDPIHEATVRHLAAVRGVFERFAEQAAVTDARETAYQVQILMMGAIVSASRGDLNAARRARPLVVSLLAGSR